MSLDKIEIVSVIEALARDKAISKEQLIADVEKAIEEIGKQKYGNFSRIKAKLNRKTGSINLYHLLEIVDKIDDANSQILLNDIPKNYDHKDDDDQLKVGDYFYDLLPFVDLGRTEAMFVRTSVTNAIKKAERDKEYKDFIGRVGEIISGVVKRIEFGHLIIDLGRTEALLKRDQLISNDRFKIGDRVKSYIQEVRKEEFGCQIFLSRTNDQIVAKLFEIEVPEIHDGLIKIKAVARDPGSKTKVAVYAIDSNTDAIACCVGMKGSRVKAIMEELGGEKIDVISWSNDIAKYVVNALSISKISKVFVDQDSNKVEVVVGADQLSSAIGRGGQNVKLASKLTKYNIDILTEENESKRRMDEFYSISEKLIAELELDETLGQFLVAKGFTSISQIAAKSIEELTQIEGFDHDLATELNKRASEALEKKNQLISYDIKALGVEKSLIDFLNFIELKDILALAKAGVKSFEDLALFTPNELSKILQHSLLSEQNLHDIINEARFKSQSDEE